MNSAEVFKYVLTGAYVILVYGLSWVGMRRTKDISGFAIGNKDMSPYLIGITLAASIASTATFVITQVLSMSTACLPTSTTVSQARRAFLLRLSFCPEAFCAWAKRARR